MVLTDDEIKIIKALFCKQDSNGNDYITLADFRAILDEQFSDEGINVTLTNEILTIDDKTGLDSCLPSREK